MHLSSVSGGPVIKIPPEDIITKIKEKAGLSDEELNRKIRQKMDQLAGLISREGALHILANEHGVKLYEDQSGRLKIRSLLSGMRNIELLGKVVETYEVREFQTKERKGKVGSCLIADETSKIRVVLWGSQTDQLASLKKDDLLLIHGAYVKDNQGRRELHLGDNATLTVNPEGEAAMQTVQAPNTVRKSIAELQDNDQDIELLGTVVQTYSLNFFDVCPQCNRRARPQGEGHACDQHGMVSPSTSYVLNLFLDDGSGNIRTVFFRNQVNNLLEKQQEEILAYRASPESFEQVKHDLLGRAIKVIGKASRNAMFDRLEFTAQRVYPRPSAEEELKRLGGTIENVTPIQAQVIASPPVKEIVMTAAAGTMAETSFVQPEEEAIDGEGVEKAKDPAARPELPKEARKKAGEEDADDLLSLDDIQAVSDDLSDEE